MFPNKLKRQTCSKQNAFVSLRCNANPFHSKIPIPSRLFINIISDKLPVRCLFMEDQSGCFEQVLQDFHKNENHIRLISQEPERLDDEGFVQICLSCESVGIGELPSALQPLMERLLATSDGASDGQMLPDVMEERGSILKEVGAQ